MTYRPGCSGLEGKPSQGATASHVIPLAAQELCGLVPKPGSRGREQTRIDMAMPSPNLAARAASWSAHHRRRTILGWLALVFVAYALGAALGTVLMNSTDQGIGDSGQAQRI